MVQRDAGLGRRHAQPPLPRASRQQLRLLSRATIALSPAGGVSMILPFLPEGAHAILINYMLAERGKRGARAAAGSAAAGVPEQAGDEGASSEGRRMRGEAADSTHAEGGVRRRAAEARSLHA